MSRPFAILVAAALALTGPVHAGDAVAGQAAAATCVACHGEGGAKPIANYPIIAGQHEDYLYRTMVGYRDGDRSNQVMAPLMAGLTDLELANLAAYFASQPSPLR